MAGWCGGEHLVRRHNEPEDGSRRLAGAELFPKDGKNSPRVDNFDYKFANLILSRMK